MKNLLEAYYSPYKDVLSKFKQPAPTKTFDEMFAFFESNLVNLEKQPLYFELLNREINDIFKSGQKNITSIRNWSGWFGTHFCGIVIKE